MWAFLFKNDTAMMLFEVNDAIPSLRKYVDYLLTETDFCKEFSHPNTQAQHVIIGFLLRVQQSKDTPITKTIARIHEFIEEEWKDIIVSWPNPQVEQV